MAVERIAVGARIMDIAAETGAHKSLVAKWVREPRADGTEDAPAFVEVLLPAGKPTPRQERPVAPPPPPDTPFCRVRLGGAEIEIPPGYPGAHLADILRAVREPDWTPSSRHMMAEAFAQIDKEEIDPILSITTKGRLIMTSDHRGNYTTLTDATGSDCW